MQDQAKNSDSNEKKTNKQGLEFVHKHNKQVDTTNKSQPRCKRQHKQTKFNDGWKSKNNHKIIIYKNDNTIRPSKQRREKTTSKATNISTE